jgi:hypothetical protein
MGGKEMGYETRLVLAVDKEYYEEVHWGKFQDLIDETRIEDDKIVYFFDWGKGVYKALDYFLEEIVIREGGYMLSETFGAITLGEDDSDIEHIGMPEEFGIYLTRDIDVE